jgi:hypothetical protein
MKFTPEQRNLIKETRSKIQKLENEQAVLYSNLLKGINVNEKAEDWLFDYVYNSFGSIKNIEKILS